MSLSSTYRVALLSLGYALIVLVAHWLIIPSPAYATRPTLIGAAMLFDLTILPLAMVYGLIARPQRWSGIRLGLVGMALFRLALVWLPGSFITTLPAPMVWIGLLEGLVLGIMAFRLRTIIRTYRTYRRTQEAATAWRGALSAVFGEKLTAFMASEAEVVYYALAGWWQHADVPAGALPITSHRESGQLALLWGLLGISGIELVAVHLLLMQWAPAAALWVTLLSAYGCLLLLTVIHTTRARPSYLTADALHLRLDVRWQVAIPRDHLASVTPINDRLPRHPGLLNAALLTAPNVLITFNRPIVVQGLYGVTRTVTQITLCIDEQKAFRARLGI